MLFLAPPVPSCTVSVTASNAVQWLAFVCGCGVAAGGRYSRRALGTRTARIMTANVSVATYL
eukprot:2483616-Prymnesium_polylepis.1